MAMGNKLFSVSNMANTPPTTVCSTHKRYLRASGPSKMLFSSGFISFSHIVISLHLLIKFPHKSVIGCIFEKKFFLFHKR